MNCKFCNKECKNSNSLKNHERLCKLNPSRAESSFIKANKLGKNVWNKGLTKETDSRVSKQSESLSNSIKNGTAKWSFLGKHHTIESKKKISKTMIDKGLGGTHSRAAYIYKDLKFDSMYEIIVAKSLDKNNIKWEKSGKFKWHDLNNKQHNYTPDFYLPDYNVYLDPKNDYLITKDTLKIDQVIKENNIKVIILDKEHLTWDKIINLL